LIIAAKELIGAASRHQNQFHHRRRRISDNDSAKPLRRAGFGFSQARYAISAPASYLAGMRISHGKGTRMRHLLMYGTLAVTAATIISPVQAQVPGPPSAQLPRPPAAYSGSSFPYPFPAPTPEDAYKEGLINRWKYEQLEGPLPSAMQGPSPDGSRGGGGGDSRGG
jgi:hypothetical protein